MSKNIRVGQVIRDLRRARNITAEELGKKVGLSQPRISKIETGVDPNPKPADIEAILHILEAPQTIRQQVLEASGSNTTTRMYKLKSNFPYQKALELQRNATYIRTFVNNLIPALLQTIEYRQALSERIVPGDMQASLTTIAKRQDLLWDKRRRYHFILHEAGLYTTPATRAIQVTQLDRVDRFIGMQHVKIGVIPLEAGLTPAENGTFVIYDEQRLIKTFANGEIITRESEDIASHLKIFAELDKRTGYGDSAHALIRKAMDYFS